MDKTKAPCVAIIGAGVIGLQTAIQLLEDGNNVVIIAKHFPGDESIDYTSPWAGAQWRSHSSPLDRQQQAWDLMTYQHWKQLCFSEHASDVPKEHRSGLTILPAKLLYDSTDHRDLAPNGDPSSGEGFWFKTSVDSFEVLDPKSCARNVAAAVKYNSIFIDVPVYLCFLLSRVRELGGVTVRASLPVNSGISGAINATLPILEKLFGASMAIRALFVNASGLGARQLCGDLKVYPIRGQVLVVKGWVGEATSRLGTDEETGEPYVAYVIPRPLSGTTIIGGSQRKNDWSPYEDPALTKKILQRCEALAPGLLTGPNASFETIGCQVGLRPGRIGGARMERETVTDWSGRSRLVVHAYGHGGAGFQNSIGVARSVSNLLGESTIAFNSKI